ncbi:hypothetical protein SAMN05216333_12523 [Nitrosomonas oligotropha]|uniref:Uncharacterized protein n=1 Tax=Nitrosomonas oligotropha TaxID=42354 RepID=A0A1H8TJT7_9PROT|nr:hypothetical protein C8R26_12935 [Nitrosomonas oligotropha]SDX31909.1 hypothetical protein SAMN05216300_12823 [Nitrosomonas oligotropha]SEO91091.1 hypothetical protein SAMN05216333_12523 [Nitrosomonas oligotropha]
MALHYVAIFTVSNQQVIDIIEIVDEVQRSMEFSLFMEELKSRKASSASGQNSDTF